MQRFNKNSIGLFGGTFDPPHYGHLNISKESIKRFKLKKIYWVVTKKNPYKKKAFFSLDERIKKSKSLIKKNKKINVVFLDKKVKSSRTVDIYKYLQRKNKKSNFFIIIGSDSLVAFHKWKNWRYLVNNAKLVVFFRKGYGNKLKKSVITKVLKSNNVIFVKNKSYNISSSKLRKNYL